MEIKLSLQLFSSSCASLAVAMSRPHALLGLVCGGKKIHIDFVNIIGEFADDTAILHDAPHLVRIPRQILRLVPDTCRSILRGDLLLFADLLLVSEHYGPDVTYEVLRYNIENGVLKVTFRLRAPIVDPTLSVTESCRIPLQGHPAYAAVAEAGAEVTPVDVTSAWGRWRSGGPARGVAGLCVR